MVGWECPTKPREASGLDPEAVHYAVFHAAQAALYARGENPTSHGHVRQQFGQEIVLEGDATRAQGRLLGELYDSRQEADYGAGTPSVDADQLLEEAEAFVDHMAALVERDVDET